MTELTKAEEQVMQYLWKLGKGFLKDIVDQFPQPKPAYTTVSTVIRVLVKKGAIGFNTYGKIHEYYPLISKSEYFRSQMKSLVSNFFNGSTTSFVSAFTETENLSISELEKIKKVIESKIKEKDKNNG
ncbi:MAG TPA: BlaI/MecI/CopY family transcriptional regulator [Tenuifilaceae bacterium]|nr:BlaI/MecI/CopY family transcriptional regulator [Tenuifilaceae bacterium]HPE17760.1 BlaI/MecI/CopY family transcriptional regulator [Tenuifilaceae bacterium]HPJ45037.1 BlaI/MecI/CopY family transcriptional regulator [Tenuifilaceae bacterium]HPQ34139.1 BlaI/MecI/CopY family transcriptional regulator [Tenuifilaceae bacterium]HRX67161.1 BlaI/MecI/CopY family transcriptional regulator [Tenuifilaceae bacterium]